MPGAEESQVITGPRNRRWSASAGKEPLFCVVCVCIKYYKYHYICIICIAYTNMSITIASGTNDLNNRQHGYQIRRSDFSSSPTPRASSSDIRVESSDSTYIFRFEAARRRPQRTRVQLSERAFVCLKVTFIFKRPDRCAQCIPGTFHARRKPVITII